MSNQACVSCGRRKGRRACPALDGPICSTCCGTKRLTEIPCPPDCAYLETAKQHPPAVVQRRHEREARFLIPLLHDLSDRQHRLFLFVQSVIARHRPAALPPLVDADVAEATGALAATLETERRGIIYEHRAASLPAQRLEQALDQALQAPRQNAPTSFDRDLVAVLRRTERAGREASAALSGDDCTYLDLVQHTLYDIAMRSGATELAADQADLGDEPSGLIVPGRG